MHGRYMSSMADYTKEYSKKLKYNTEDDDLISDFDAEHSMRSYSQAREKSCWRLSCNYNFFCHSSLKHSSFNLHDFNFRFKLMKEWIHRDF